MMKNRCHLILFLHALCSCLRNGVTAASENTNGRKYNDEESLTIQIVGFPDASVQKLPTAYLKSMQRGILEGESIVMVPGTTSSSVNDGYINPISISKLWWPADLDQLQIRPTMDVIVQNGIPKYVAGGIDVCVKVSKKKEKKHGGCWRNHGMNSQPLPQQWTTFENVGKPNFRFDTFIERISDDTAAETEETTERQWISIFETNRNDDPSVEAVRKEKGLVATKNALEVLGMFLSGFDGTDHGDEIKSFTQGFQILSIPLADDWYDLPEIETVMDPSYNVITLGTALPDAKALMGTKPELAAKLGTSVMAISVMPTAPGSDSENLPDAYKALYI